MGQRIDIIKDTTYLDTHITSDYVESILRWDDSKEMKKFLPRKITKLLSGFVNMDFDPVQLGEPCKSMGNIILHKNLLDFYLSEITIQRDHLWRYVKPFMINKNELKYIKN